jgi:hypothetical protein
VRLDHFLLTFGRFCHTDQGDYLTSSNSIIEFPATIARGIHPTPFRTRKLSPSALMVLHGRLCGRVGRCRNLFERPEQFILFGPFFLRLPLISFIAGSGLWPCISLLIESLVFRCKLSSINYQLSAALRSCHRSLCSAIFFKNFPDTRPWTLDTRRRSLRSPLPPIPSL